MAESILKLKVDSQEYESKVRRAADGIQALGRSLQNTGKTFVDADKEQIEFVQALGKMDTVATSTKQQVRELSNALTTLTMTYRDMSEEEKNSPIGQALSNSIQQLTERAGKVQDAMTDVQKSIKNASSDTRTFDQLAQGMSVATVGFQGLTGAGKLLGIEMGNDVQVIAKLQAAMAVTNSLTTIQTALQEESALMMGVASIQAKAAAVAQDMLAKNTIAATAAQRAFNLVAKANPYVLLVTAIAAVGTALWGLGKATSSAEDDIEEMEKTAEEAKKKLEEFRDSLTNAASSAMSSASYIDHLIVSYKKSNDEISKTNILHEAADEFKKLGIECKGVDDAQQLLIAHGGQIVEMLRLQGNAAAISAMRMEAFKQSFQNIIENQIAEGIKPNLNYAATLAGSAVAEYDEMLNSINGQIRNIKASLPTTPKTTPKGKPDKTVNPDEIFPEGSLKQLQQQMQKLQEAQGLVTDTSSWRELQQQIDVVTNRVSILKGELPKDKVFSLRFDNADSLQGVLDQLNAINGVTIDEKTLTVTADTSEAMRQVQQLTENIENTTVELKVKPVELAVGISGTNQGTISSFIQQLQQELESIDFSVAGSFQKATNLNANIIDATTLGNLLKTSIQEGIDLAAAGIDVESLFDKIASGEGIENADWKGLAEKINEQLKAQGIELNIDTKTGNVSSKKNEANTTAKAIEKFNSDYSKLTGGVSSIVSGIQSMGVEIPKGIQSVLGVLSGISSIMTGITAILTLIQLDTKVTAAATVADAATPLFARGGIVHAAGGYMVQGNNFSGDLVPAYLNSGEMVLNRQQQMILAGTLENNGLKNINISGALRGEDIVLVADRFGKRTGKGELVFWKN